MVRPREYKHREPFTSSMEADLLEKLRKICRQEDIDMNAIWKEAAEKFIEEYRPGILQRKAQIDIPTVQANANELLKWAYAVGPDNARKVLQNLNFLYKTLSNQMRAIEITAREKARQTTSSKTE